MTPAGQVALQASYSTTGGGEDSKSGFFVEEDGTLVEILYSDMTISTGITMANPHVTVFNAGRILFWGVLEGDGVLRGRDIVSCMYKSGGITVLARERDPVPLINGDMVIKSGTGALTPLGPNKNAPLGPNGETIIYLLGIDWINQDKIMVLYSWDPVNEYVILRNGGIIPKNTPSEHVSAGGRINSAGNISLMGKNPTGSKTCLWTLDQQNEETLIVTDSAEVADGAGGATFTRLMGYVLFDDGQIGMHAETSDGKLGIWIGDQNGMRKVARIGDQAPGVEQGMKFSWVNRMITNRRGQVAFPDVAVHLNGNVVLGIWAGNANGLELVAVSGEEIKVGVGESAVVRTIDQTNTGDWGYYNVIHWTTGADGHPSTFNNTGELAFGVQFFDGENALLIATPELIVNSDKDTPDADTTDGICDTGGPLVNGKPECTLRAAIMEANNQAGRDVITFNIPGDGIPSINYISNLPTITDPVVIDGTTQSGGMVALKGYLEGLQTSTQDPNPEEVHGFVFKADDLEVIGFSFTGFSGNGILIEDCDNARVTQCKPIGNHKHGILIKNSSDVRIGGSEPGVGNVITDNQEAGIYVESGDGNKFRHNSIFDNGGLGIDLAPVGVNPNDEGDPHGGANTGINYPFIDSVKTIPQGGSTIYGTVRGAPANIHYIDIFYNNEGDESSHGEGMSWMVSTLVMTNNEGVGKFIAGAFPLGASQFVTATATDQYNNTSEFSPWWPHKALIIKDADDNPLANMEFKLSRVNNDPPQMSETEVAVITTDEKGRVDLNQYYREGSLSLADSLKVYRHLHSEPRPKVGVPDLGTGYSVHLDNAEFDSETYRMYYDTLSVDTLQTIVLDHTTLAVNLVISIEWEAGDEFRDSVVSCMRILSNYLYDVTDGQLRLDSIIIFDKKVQWGNSDMHILADNYWRPGATADGFYDWNPRNEPHILMSRRWYGTGFLGAEHSWSDYPIFVAAQWNYRAMAHELGHYFFNFRDEYPNDGNPDLDDPRYPTRVHPIYGIMQTTYYPSPVCSELSSSAQYFDGRKNTRQWYKHVKSCWDYFKEKYEKPHDGIRAPIQLPDDRELKEGTEYFIGPNDNLADLDYDVGALVWTNNLPQERTSIDQLVVLLDPVHLNLLSGVVIEHFHHPLPGSERQEISQGATSLAGIIMVLGVNPGDTLLVDGRRYHFFPLPKRGADQSAEPFAWFSGMFELTGAAEVTYYPTPVYGSFPLIVSSAPTATDLTLKLEAPSPFASQPSVELRTVDDLTGNYPLVSSPNGYAATITDDLSNSGMFQVTAIDDSASSFFFRADYVNVSLPGNGTPAEVTSNKGDFDLLIDGSNSTLNRAVVVSTDFPEIRGNLSPDDWRVSRVHSLNVYPAAELSGTNILRFGYSPLGLETPGQPTIPEMSIRLFRWSEPGSVWEPIPCVLDTTQKIIHALITKAGSYAAFTTEVGTAVIESDDERTAPPSEFDITQNYPNPFNPATTISYSVPEPTRVTITIYNVLGRQIRQFEEGLRVSGQYTVLWDGTDHAGRAAASGVYFYQIQAGGNVETKKMVLLK